MASLSPEAIDEIFETDKMARLANFAMGWKPRSSSAKNSQQSHSSAASSSFFRAWLGNNRKRVFAWYKKYRKQRNRDIANGIALGSEFPIYRKIEVYGFPFATQRTNEQYSSNCFVWGNSTFIDQQAWQALYGGAGSEAAGLGYRIHFTRCWVDMRNNYSRTAEIDLWEMWPKEDIQLPDNTSLDQVADWVSPVPSDAKAAQQFITPNAMQQGFLAQAAQVTVPGEVEVAIGVDDYSRSPNDSLYHRSFFKLRKKGNFILPPGASLRIQTLNRGYSYDPADMLQMFVNSGSVQYTAPFNFWALLRRGGPQYCMRIRGLVAHDESTESDVLLKYGQTMGSAALDVVFKQEVCFSKMTSDTVYGTGTEFFEAGQVVPVMTLANESAAEQYAVKYPVGELPNAAT